MHRLIRAAAVAAVSSAAFAPAASAGQIIVDFVPGTSSAARDAALRAVGGAQRVGTVDVNGAEVLRVPGAATTAAAVLNRSNVVLYAEPDLVLRATATPNDPRFAELYGIHNTGQSGGTLDADLDGPEGWDLAGLSAFPATGGAKVGIVDTGVQANHPDLAGKTVNCAGVSNSLLGGTTVSESNGCADDNDHGTHVSGTIAAIANNGIGVAGVAFNAPLAHCKALGGLLGTGSTSGVANCITYLASKNAKVISMSLGGGSSSTLQTAVRSAWNNGNGSLLVAAAGNDGNSTVNYPAGYAEVVSVAATDRNDRKASFSNVNSDVEVAAAGVDVLSTVRGSTYRALSGTSMATPHVAGVASLIAFRNPTFTAGQVRSKLQTAVDDLGAAGRDSTFGYGRVTLSKAL